MVIPVLAILLVPLALFAYGEFKEWRGRKQGELQGETRARATFLPLLEQECRERDKYWLNVLRVHSLPAPQPPQPLVLQLGDGMELRQKPVRRMPPREGK